MADRRGGNTPEDLDQQDEGFVFVFDRRHKNGGCAKISLGGLFDYQMFRLKVKEVVCLFVYLLTQAKFFWQLIS